MEVRLAGKKYKKPKGFRMEGKEETRPGRKSR